ncbi:type II toxin-antitoxin system ParD family antitoxin [Plectonema cf. radiosum LEGE 06105]|uniref:Type II toxin-antitoxin system ParD family antitoxin n=1 Tax=Plectonema cf. radiosum LEGE 06105 TaxID=945769 RepID=A0A8J7F1G4_9CYAN|nr:type II toxin-antitoxin system ParD family antitoxin [Plectonema radiosum]MBE9214273.1 type II toxin-antitoxin system ParD family antitoxin [Plectonema cf. radiosum LEGE 06105]
MNISLDPTHEQFVISKIESGKYANADEVIAAALQLLEEQEQHILWLNDTRQKIAIGLEEIERGDVLDTEVVINQLKDKLLQKREAQT